MDKNERTCWKILQLLPAQPGWRAVFAWSSKPDEGELGYDALPIVAWTLVENVRKEPLVVALYVCEADEVSLPDAHPQFVLSAETGFLGYDYPDCEVAWGYLADFHRERYWDETNGEWIA